MYEESNVEQLHSSSSLLLHPYRNFSGNSSEVSLPVAPSALASAGISKSSIGLKWLDNSNNEQGFKLYRSLTSTGGFIEIASIGANTTTYTDNSLQPQTSYYYKLLAYNQFGSSGYSSVFKVTTTLLDIPAPPTQFACTAQTTTTINLIWKDNSTREKGFILYRSASETGSYAEISTNEANETSCIDNSLQPGISYFYKLRAFNDDGYSDYTPVLMVTTKHTSDSDDETFESKTIYIDPGNENDASANGSIYHPFDSWSDIVWKEGFTYLQKRGTSATVDKLQIGASNVTIGAYGDGDMPVISSQTNTYMVSGFETSGFHIKDLDLQASKAVSCIYFLGSASDSIVVEHCLLKASSNAIKIVDASTLIAKYNRISSEQEGIFSTASSNAIYYNNFDSCITAVNIMSKSAHAEIFNNVFADNMRSVAVSYAELSLYNNIFYLSNPNQVALNQGTGRIASDNNIYYPEQAGFISVAGKRYNNLDEIQKELKIKLKSYTTNPRFIDIINKDYRLSSGSPAINTGRNIKLSNDLDGNKVPLFAITDIGAFEFNGNLVNPSQKTSSRNSNIKVYPNPSNGPVVVVAEFADGFVPGEPSVMVQELKVVDMAGKTIISKHINISGYDPYQENLDLSGFANGLYFVVIQIADQVVREKLLLLK